MAPLSKPDLACFSRIDSGAAVAMLIATIKEPVSSKQLDKRLKSLFPEAGRRTSAIEIAEQQKLVTQESGHVGKTDKGVALLGRDAARDTEALRTFRLPALACGLDPDDAHVRKAMSGRTAADALRAATIGVAYGLPAHMHMSLKEVASEIVWRTLRSAMPDIMRNAKTPVIEKSNAVDRAIVAGLAGAKSGNIKAALASLAAGAVGARSTEIGDLRKRLIEIALQGKPAAASPTANHFVARVRAVAANLTTPSFPGRVAIAQVYDAYGRDYGDAGSLDSFKHRLVEAAKARELDLSRLDSPARMSAELRLRSQTAWGSDEVHLIVTDWK